MKKYNEKRSLNARHDIIGKKFGRWTVLEFAYGRSNYCGHPTLYYFKCKCDCGTIRNVRKDRLTCGQTTGCDCVRIDAIRLPYGQAAFNSLYRAYKSNSKHYKKEFTLSEKEFYDLTSSPCHYCGSPPLRKYSHDKKFPFKNGDYFFNGIDRKDNAKGYITGNCLPCCKDCNYSKRKRGYEEFKDWIVRVYRNISNV